MKTGKVKYLNDVGIELLHQGHMKNTKEFLYVTVKDRKLYIFDGNLWVELRDDRDQALEAIRRELK